jgi:hypothetical protein
LVVLAGGLAAQAAAAADRMTGCLLGESGNLNRFALGDQPNRRCRARDTEVTVPLADVDGGVPAVRRKIRGNLVVG